MERLRAASETLALIGLPALIDDLKGKALAANSLIGAMTKHVVWLPKDRVALTDAAANSMLRRAVAEGLSLKQIAERHGSSQATVRHQLKSIFARTGVGRQSQLAALLVAQIRLPHAPDGSLRHSLSPLSIRFEPIKRQQMQWSPKGARRSTAT